VADVVGYGENYRAYLERRLFEPIGMTSAVATFDTSGVFVASSFVHARALDFAKFGLLYLRGGEWENQQLILARMGRHGTNAAERRSLERRPLFLAVVGQRRPVRARTGRMATRARLISVVPALDAVVVRFGHTPEENYEPRMAWRERVLAVLAQ